MPATEMLTGESKQLKEYNCLSQIHCKKQTEKDSEGNLQILKDQGQIN